MPEARRTRDSRLLAGGANWIARLDVPARGWTINDLSVLRPVTGEDDAIEQVVTQVGAGVTMNVRAGASLDELIDHASATVVCVANGSLGIVVPAVVRRVPLASPTGELQSMAVGLGPAGAVLAGVAIDRDGNLNVPPGGRVFAAGTSAGTITVGGQDAAIPAGGAVIEIVGVASGPQAASFTAGGWAVAVAEVQPGATS